MNNPDAPVLLKNLMSLLSKFFHCVHSSATLAIVNIHISFRIDEGIPLTDGVEPGGYLQWFEPLAMSVSVWKPDPNMPTPALDQHCKVWAKLKPYTTYE